MRYGPVHVARGGPHIVTHTRFFKPPLLAKAKTSRKCADDVINGLHSSKCAEKWCYLPKTHETPKRTMAPKLAILVVFRPCIKNRRETRFSSYIILGGLQKIPFGGFYTLWGSAKLFHPVALRFFLENALDHEVCVPGEGQRQ